MTHSDLVEVIRQEFVDKYGYWFSKGEIDALATTILERLRVDTTKVAEIIINKCHEMHAEWWEKDAEEIAVAISQSIQEILTIKERRGSFSCLSW